MANKNFDGMEQPSWYDGKTIDEVAFCASFLRQHPMKCIRWRLFTVDGLIEDEGKIQQMILDEVMSCQSIGIAKKVKSLFDTIANVMVMLRGIFSEYMAAINSLTFVVAIKVEAKSTTGIITRMNNVKIDKIVSMAWGRKAQSCCIAAITT